MDRAGRFCSAPIHLLAATALSDFKVRVQLDQTRWTCTTVGMAVPVVETSVCKASLAVQAASPVAAVGVALTVLWEAVSAVAVPVVRALSL